MNTLTQELLDTAETLKKNLQDLVSPDIEEDIISEEDYQAVTEALKKNTPEFITLKLIEELAELQEKLIKYHLKSPSHKPKMTEILDEVGDVGLRIILFIEHHSNDEFSAMDYVEDRTMKKIKKLSGYLKEGKYTGGL